MKFIKCSCCTPLSSFHKKDTRTKLEWIFPFLAFLSARNMNIKGKTWNSVSCAERVVASVWRVWTFLSSSEIYRAFLSFERAADCRFARILQEMMNHIREGQKEEKKQLLFISIRTSRAYRTQGKDYINIQAHIEHVANKNNKWSTP